jgi:hypothetical protein
MESFPEAAMTMHPQLEAFLEHAVDVCRADTRIEAVLVAGSAVTLTTDRFSDLDLVIVCRDDDYPEIMRTRLEFAGSLGPLLAAFTGEHVGEPRLLICLYDAPLLHVDLKFVTRDSLAQRVETPLVAFDREGKAAAAVGAGVAEWPLHTPEWFEDRFWIWAHYGAGKIARGELFEAHDLLAFVRAQVLGPMLARKGQHRQRGVRQIEFEDPDQVAVLARTIPLYDRADCWRALSATVDMYVEYRRFCPPSNQCGKAESAVRAYIAEYAR